jgi:hypoxanthine phosphoribosyltransferase
MVTLEPLISPDQIRQKVADIAKAIDQQCAGEELTIVMVMKGAFCLTSDLIRELKSVSVIEYLKASSYGKLGVQRGELILTGIEELHLAGKNVLLIDDIYDSGETLSQIISKLKTQNPKTLKSLVLLSKKGKRQIKYTPDYVLFDIEDQFVVGYGLDYKEHYRGLPGIYILKEESK